MSSNDSVRELGMSSAEELVEMAHREENPCWSEIITEPLAQHTAHSAQLILPLLQEIQAETIVLVTSWWHAKRNWLTVRKQFDLNGGKHIQVFVSLVPPWWYGQRLLSSWMRKTCQGERDRIGIYSEEGDCYPDYETASAVDRS